MSIFASQFDRARTYAEDYAGHHSDPGLADPVTRHRDDADADADADADDWGAGWDQDWDLDPSPARGPDSNAEAAEHAENTHHDASGTQDARFLDADPQGTDEVGDSADADEKGRTGGTKHAEDAGWKHPDDQAVAGSENGPFEDGSGAGYAVVDLDDRLPGLDEDHHDPSSI